MKSPEHVLESVATMFTASAALKWIAALLMALASYFLPTKALADLAVGAFGLVVLDTVTGVIAAKTDGVAISSARFGRLLSKLVGYGTVVIVCSLVTRNLVGMSDLAPAATTAALTLVMVTESLSIIENLDRMGVKFPSFIREALKSQGEKE